MDLGKPTWGDPPRLDLTYVEIQHVAPWMCDKWVIDRRERMIEHFTWLEGLGNRHCCDFWYYFDKHNAKCVYMFKDPKLAMLFKLTWCGT